MSKHVTQLTVDELLAVPKYVLLYDGQFRGFEGPEVYVSDVVDGFDLRELMRG